MVNRMQLAHSHQLRNCKRRVVLLKGMRADCLDRWQLPSSALPKDFAPQFGQLHLYANQIRIRLLQDVLRHISKQILVIKHRCGRIQGRCIHLHAQQNDTRRTQPNQCV